MLGKYCPWMKMDIKDENIVEIRQWSVDKKFQTSQRQSSKRIFFLRNDELLRIQYVKKHKKGYNW